MAEIGHWNACVNRLYYACFYAVSALLAHHGLSASKHTAVRSLFYRHFVRSGMVSRELADLYRDLFENRQEGDYADFVRFQDLEVRPWLIDAREFVACIEHVLAPPAAETPDA